MKYIIYTFFCFFYLSLHSQEIRKDQQSVKEMFDAADSINEKDKKNKTFSKIGWFNPKSDNPFEDLEKIASAYGTIKGNEKIDTRSKPIISVKNDLGKLKIKIFGLKIELSKEILDFDSDCNSSFYYRNYPKETPRHLLNIMNENYEGKYFKRGSLYLEVLFDDRTIIPIYLQIYNVSFEKSLYEIDFDLGDSKKLLSLIKANKKMYVRFKGTTRSMQFNSSYCPVHINSPFSDAYDSDSYIEFDLTASTKALEIVE